MKCDCVERQPMLSIIVPVYKVEKYLSECVESIINQTYSDFELLLVDDGSPDRCPEICEDYAEKDSRIRVIHKENGGVSSARNVGIQNASGVYVMFVDSDDYLAPQMLEEMLCANGNKVDCVLSSLTYVYPKAEKNRSCNLPDIENLSFPDINRCFQEVFDNYGFSAVYAKLYRRELIEAHEIYFNERFSILEDGMFVFDYLKQCKKLRLLSGAYYQYRQAEDDSLMKRFNSNADQALAEYYHKTYWIRQYLDEINQKKLSTSIFSTYINFLMQIYYRSTLSSSEKAAMLKRYAGLAEEIGLYGENVELTRKNKRLCRMLQDKDFLKLHLWLTAKSFIWKKIRNYKR